MSNINSRLDRNIPVAAAVHADHFPPPHNPDSRPPATLGYDLRNVFQNSRIAGGYEPSSTLQLLQQSAHNLSRGNLEARQRADNAPSLRDFAPGLREAMASVGSKIPLRIFVVDNSGSMLTQDGHTYSDRGGRPTDDTRYEELKQSVTKQAEIAGDLGAPTVFQLVDPQGQSPVTVSSPHDVAKVRALLNRDPYGVTPLAARIREVTQVVREVAEQRRREGLSPLGQEQRIPVVIATDGLPTQPDSGSSTRADRRELETELRKLSVWPVRIVVRLCTDEEEVVGYYNHLDRDPEINLDVLDDPQGERAEVRGTNRFVNYGLNQHRARESGLLAGRIFDLVDDSKFTAKQVKEYCETALRLSELPLPDRDWPAFKKAINTALKSSSMPKEIHPKTGKEIDIIDVAALQKRFGRPLGRFLS